MKDREIITRSAKLNIRVTSDFKKKIEVAARNKRISVSRFVLTAIEKELKRKSSSQN